MDWIKVIFIIGGVLLLSMLFYFGYSIIESHNICNFMNLTECKR